MNLRVEAVMIAKSKVGEHEIIHTFDLWQTPTKATKQILSEKTNDDIVKAYASWCRLIDLESYSVEHINNLNAWIKEHEGWVIAFYEM